ncbi:MAG: bacteriophage Gp15 family protein, partial [Lachnospiraceae bacterium]|nr:bacteriophage Gp15 family protein [Lachnospiraceae bacterium]
MEDFDLIIASFQSQYGIRLSRDLDGMKWDEFRAFLEGIAPETPLGRIVAIRSETDDDVLKHFSPDQRRIRSEWQSRTAQSR